MEWFYEKAVEGGDHSIAPPRRPIYVSSPAEKGTDKTLNVGRRRAFSRLIPRLALPMTACQ